MIAKKEIQSYNETHRILLRAKDFIYILPHPALQHYISNYTITFPNKNIITDHYTVIPHGSATLVLSYSSSGLRNNLFGPITKPCVVGDQANKSDMLLIIEFQPAGLFAYSAVNQKELANQNISFELINCTLNRLLSEILENTTRLDKLIEGLDKALFQNLLNTYPSALQIATQMIIKHAGNLSYQELSTTVYYSQRHLKRIFDYYLGMSTKTFSRLIRINKSIRLMQNQHCNIACTSYETGFYDLPHFIHDFKSICGITPQQYRNNMSDFYSEIAKF